MTSPTPTFEPVNKANLLAHVKELTKQGPRHESNRDGVLAALGYLKKTLSGYGYHVQEEKYGKKDPHEVNLWCELPGTGSDPVLEIGAHWDTVAGSVGADDNASGVAGVLEVARMLQADHTRVRKVTRTLRFCLFGGEEETPLLCTGSRHHVDSLEAAPDGIIVLEMIACRKVEPKSQRIPEALGRLIPELTKQTTGDFIAAIGRSDATGYLDALGAGGRKRSVPVVSVPLPLMGGNYAGTDMARSDHFPYWKKGWKGVMVTDTADFRYLDYHRPTDTIDKLDFDFAAQVTAAVADAVRKLVGLPEES